MKIVGRQAVFEKIDVPRFKTYPLAIVRWFGIWISPSHPTAYWDSPSSIDIAIPNSVGDALEKQ